MFAYERINQVFTLQAIVNGLKLHFRNKGSFVKQFQVLALTSRPAFFKGFKSRKVDPLAHLSSCTTLKKFNP